MPEQTAHQLEEAIVSFMQDRNEAVDVRDLLIEGRESGKINGAPDKIVMLAVYRLLDMNRLVFTTDRRLKLLPAQPKVRQRSARIINKSHK